MIIVASNTHLQHNPAHEFLCGQVTEYFEKPERAAFVLEAVTKRGLGDVIAPKKFPAAALEAVHDPAYLDFLRHAHERWVAEGHEGDVVASAYNLQHLGAPAPRCVEGATGYYTADGSVPITATSWAAIEESAFIALTAQRHVADSGKSAFALCRPPGHHATRAVASGYCFINNAAVAAQALWDGGAERVAVLDVDYHHGNGTQDIFYRRGDVFFASIHADPRDEYPYFAGHADEKGAGAGEGCNANYPLPLGTDFGVWRSALDDALAGIGAFGPDVLVVSLGVDAYKEDPISHFRLESEDFIRIGERIAGLGKPSLFVMEGGYAIADVGENVANLLEGYQQAR